MEKKLVNLLIFTDLAKMKKKIEKKGVAGDTIANAAKISTRNIDAPKRTTMASKAASVSKSASPNAGKNKKYKEGSLASKANMVTDFNEKNTK